MLKFVMIHGLGGLSISFWPLETYLAYKNIGPIYKVNYVSKSGSLDQVVENLEKEMEKIANKKEDKLVLITQSLGGVLSIRLKGWKIIHNIFIVSPLRGAHLVDQIKSTIPTFLYEWFKPDVAEELTDDHIVDPPCFRYSTISTSWPGSNFDGRVYQNETIIEESNHYHIPNSGHIMIFLNPQLFYIVAEILERVNQYQKVLASLN